MNRLGTYDERPIRIKTETPKGIIHYGAKGVHIVPSRP
ncbi:polymorphic toxin type 50 domain-containing protein [Rhizobium rhizogenes]